MSDSAILSYIIHPSGIVIVYASGATSEIIPSTHMNYDAIVAAARTRNTKLLQEALTAETKISTGLDDFYDIGTNICSGPVDANGELPCHRCTTGIAGKCPIFDGEEELDA